MRRVLVALVSALTALALTAGPALADTPTSITRTGGLHFVGEPTVELAGNANSGYYLVGSGEVAGAGRTATATLSADAELVTGCINRGSKGQEPSGLERTTTPVLGTETFNTRQGRGSFTVDTVDANHPAISASSRTCPDRMTPVLVSLTFTNITLSVTSQTGTTTAYYADISVP